MLSGIMKHLDTDMWIFFLNWIAWDKEVDAKFIVDLIEKPYKYQDLWDEFIIEYNKEDD